MTGRFNPLALPTLTRRLMKRTFSDLSASNSLTTAASTSAHLPAHPSLPARPAFPAELDERRPKVPKRHASSSVAAALKLKPNSPAPFPQPTQSAPHDDDHANEHNHEPDEHHESEEHDMPSNSRSLADRIGPRHRQPLPPQQAAWQGTRGSRSASTKGKSKAKPEVPILPDPLHDDLYIRSQYPIESIKPGWRSNPKSTLMNWLKEYEMPYAPKWTIGQLESRPGAAPIFRCEVDVDTPDGVHAVGDGMKKTDSEARACLAALAQLQAQDLLDKKATKKVHEEIPNVDNTLSDGTVLSFERAEHFMEYYCKRFRFNRPTVTTQSRVGGKGQIWESVMIVDGRRVGLGAASQKKEAEKRAYIDTAVYIEKCDPGLWADFSASNPVGSIGMAPDMRMGFVSHGLVDSIRELSQEVRAMTLSANRPQEPSPAIGSSLPPGIDTQTSQASKENQSDANEWMLDDEPATPAAVTPLRPAAQNASGPGARFHESKSRRLLDALLDYRKNPALAAMREQRSSLPVTKHVDEVVNALKNNDVVICMAATGSGKTTQIPQLLMDRYIEENEGSQCNVLCTQPRRIAAISVAQRVARERGEQLGQSIGYQVRFEAVRPQLWGSVTFCTTGVFLKMMQGALDVESSQLDAYTHIIVDEVHERDVDTDLVLVVLRRLLRQRKAAGKTLKIILMSATIDPTLFMEYFSEENGPDQAQAPVIEIPGRSFPVEKKFIDTILPEMNLPRLASGPAGWVFREPSVVHYLEKEVGGPINSILATGRAAQPAVVDKREEPEIPYPLVALVIAHVLSVSQDGHVLVFMPGWDEMARVRDILLDPGRFPLLDQRFGDRSKYELHYLHSSVPVQEQQAVFEPPSPGVRRIILSTNIAETSVTIPDVVYVVDAGRVKEMRYDPERHLSSLVSAWVGRSNLNQRAGRAGRHRPGQYYGVLSQARQEALEPYQLVEMKRVDLSNVVMHVRAIIPSMPARDVLARTIEPPAVARVNAAISDLQRMGAMSDNEDLTALGKVIIQIPTDTHLAKLCLFGSFFRCLDPALTLAAVMASRDPFVAPIAVRKEAHAVKDSWSPRQYKSDILAAVTAYNQWFALQSSGNYGEAARFISDNFLHRQTIQEIGRLKTHLLGALENAGVLAVSGGGVDRPIAPRGPRAHGQVPEELNTNAQCLPLLAALIAMASQPNFAIKISKNSYRTYQDKSCAMHPSSVNSFKKANDIYNLNEAAGSVSDLEAKGDMFAVFAYAEKVRNVSQGEKGAQTQLRVSTKLDPMTYILFGAYQVQPWQEGEGIVCDSWLPVSGQRRVLDDVTKLKDLMDSCMLRVFEGIHQAMTTVRSSLRGRLPTAPRAERMDEDDYDGRDSTLDEEGDVEVGGPLSTTEVKELDYLTQSIVRILDRYNEETNGAASRFPSRPSTPVGRTPSGPSGASRFNSVNGWLAKPSSLNSGTRPSTPSSWRR